MLVQAAWQATRKYNERVSPIPSQLLNQRLAYLFAFTGRKEGMEDVQDKSIELAEARPDKSSLERLYTAIIRSYLGIHIDQKSSGRSKENVHVEAEI